MERLLLVALFVLGVNSEDYELCGGDVASADFPSDEVQCSISIGLPCKSSGTIRTFGYPELIASPNLGEYTFDLLACPGEVLIIQVDAIEFQLKDPQNYLEFRDGNPSNWNRGTYPTPKTVTKPRKEYPIIPPILCGTGEDSELPGNVRYYNYTTSQPKLAMSLYAKAPGAVFKVKYNAVKASSVAPKQVLDSDSSWCIGSSDVTSARFASGSASAPLHSCMIGFLSVIMLCLFK